MTGATLAYLGIAMLAMVLPVAALRQRNWSAARLAKAALIWFALFVLVALVFSGLRL